MLTAQTTSRAPASMRSALADCGVSVNDTDFPFLVI